MPLVIPVVLVCDRCASARVGVEAHFHSLFHWDLKHPEGWIVVQVEDGLDAEGEKNYKTLVWCSQVCKENTSP